MQLLANLIQILPSQTGAGKNGQWKKQEIIVETEGRFPKKICISIWGDKIDEKQLKLGNQLKIDFDIESREYNGKWYTELKAWKIETEGTSAHDDSNSTDNNILEVSTDDDEIFPF